VKNKLSKLYSELGYEFKDAELAKLALTHRSVSGRKNNERLEFLGDSVLGFVVAQQLFRQFPQASEGELSRLRAYLVRGKTLAEIAKEKNLGSFVLLGTGELKSGGHRRESILADAVEALIGGIYTESGLQVAEAVILQWYAKRFDSIDLSNSGKDAKTRLQEFTQSRRLALPVYEVTAITGTAHNQSFTVECRISMDSQNIIKACAGTSRRKAEQLAAAEVLLALDL